MNTQMKELMKNFSQVYEARTRAYVEYYMTGKSHRRCCMPVSRVLYELIHNMCWASFKNRMNATRKKGVKKINITNPNSTSKPFLSEIDVWSREDAVIRAVLYDVVNEHILTQGVRDTNVPGYGKEYLHEYVKVKMREQSQMVYCDSKAFALGIVFDFVGDLLERSKETWYFVRAKRTVKPKPIETLEQLELAL